MNRTSHRDAVAVALLVALALSLSDAVVARRAQAPPSAPAAVDLPYTSKDWPQPPASAAGAPGIWNFIQVASIAVTPRGTVLVLHRGAHPIMEFNGDGKLLRSWGDGLFSEGKVGAMPKQFWTADKSHYSAVYGPAGCTSCGAHSVRVDPEGHVWLVDAPGHVVYKMDATGQKELQRFGTFNLPTDVAFAPNGSFYVTDGYGAARVVQFSREGTFMRQWGTRGSGPAQFELPHNIAVDRQGRVYVTDRENQRVEVFDANGTFLSEWRGTGGVSALLMAADQQHIWTGHVLRDLNGNVIGKLPGNIASPHGMALTASGDVYLAQLSGVVQKFVRR